MQFRNDVQKIVRFKDHLQRLPLINDLVWSYPETSKELVILVPVFIFKDDSPKDLLDFIVPSLIYQRRSFLLNTDIVSHGVAIKAYIPEDAFPVIAETLYNAGYTDADIVLYEDTNTSRKEQEGYTQPFGAKFLFLDDDRFSEYKYIFAVDSDLFIAKSRLLPTDEVFPLVEKLTMLTEDNWYVVHTDHMWNLEMQGPRGNWMRRVNHDANLWYEKAAEYIGYDVRHIKKMLSADQSSVLYPKKFLDSGFRLELMRGIEILQDDEALTALWVLDHPYPGTTKSLIETISNVHMIESMENSKHFYIAHCRTGWEFLWRHHIGANLEN